MARLGPAIHVLVVAQESTTVKLQSLTGIGLMGPITCCLAEELRGPWRVPAARPLRQGDP
jgi:hypothetical protein